MEHELSYKPAQPIPRDIRRQIYLLNGLLEVADRSFASLNREIANLHGSGVLRLLQTLEGHFYQFTGENFDPELSQQVLEKLIPTYSLDDRTRIRSIVEDFVAKNERRLGYIYSQYAAVENRPLMLFQPESLLIFERLERDSHTLEEIWVQQYPRDELERLALAWGHPID
jgi:hypothetical protein